MTDCIEIDHLALELHAVAVSSRAEQILGRLKSEAGRRLAEVDIALGTASGPNLVDDSEQAQIFVDRIEFECALNTASNERAQFSTLAHELFGAVARGIAAGDGRHFRDRSEFIAAFLVALAEGCAWRNWWFEDFAGLRMLSVSSALRSVILSEGETGLHALTRLTSESLDRIVDVLTEGDSERIVEGWAAIRAASAPSAALVELLDCIGGESRPGTRGLLRLCVRLDRKAPGRVGSRDLRALAVLRVLIESARRGELPAPEADSLSSATLAAWCAQLGVDCSFLRERDDSDCSESASLIVALARPAERAAGSQTATLFTRNGGALLLIARLAAEGRWALWHDALRVQLPDGIECRRVAGALVLATVAQAVAREAAEAVCDDPVLRIVVGLRDESPAALLQPHVRLLGDLLAQPRPGVEERCERIAIRTGSGVLQALVDPRRGTFEAFRFASRSSRAGRLASDGHDAANLSHVRTWWRSHLRTESSRAGSRSLARLLQVNALNLLHDLGSALPGTAGSSADYLRTRCLTLPAWLELESNAIAARLGCAPLDVLLRLAGMKRGEWFLPDGRCLTLRSQAVS